MIGSPADHHLHRPCPVCGSDIATVLHEGGFVLPEGHPLSGSVSVVTCSKCGFCFNDTSSTAVDFDRYYAEMSKYADPAVSTGAGMSAEDRERLDLTADQICRFSAAENARILDIGCGAGGLLDSLARRGYSDLHGMDPSSRCADRVTASGHHGVVGALTMGMISGHQFDGVILCHVLEHVYDLHTASQCIADCMTADGWLYVEVPDARRYGACLIAPFQDFNLEHINHFSIDSLTSFLNVAGWKVADSGEKTLQLPGGNSYPAVFAFARRDHPGSAEVDRLTRSSLEDYVQRSSDELKRIENVLRNDVADRPILAWGVGQLTMRLLGESSLGKANIIAFIDSNPIHQGRKLHGRPVIAPDEISGIGREDVPILLCSLVNLESIEDSVRNRGIRNPLIRLTTKVNGA